MDHSGKRLSMLPRTDVLLALAVMSLHPSVALGTEGALLTLLPAMLLTIVRWRLHGYKLPDAKLFLFAALMSGIGLACGLMLAHAFVATTQAALTVFIVSYAVTLFSGSGLTSMYVQACMNRKAG